MRSLDLFSGIGGFSLGMEAAGIETVAFCEQDEYACRVLAKHWPGVPIYRDVRELRGADVGDIEVIMGGFPCQDISLAGKGGGIKGERSGLWSEFARIIGEVGPRWVVIENVPALRSRGLVTVLQDLSALGYDAEWHCVPAAHYGAPHRRDRIWILAYPQGQPQRPGLRQDQPAEQRRGRSGDGGGAGDLADASSERQRTRRQGRVASPGEGRDAKRRVERLRCLQKTWWTTEPDVGRVAHGVPSRVDRLKGLGNAIVPVMAYHIGEAIQDAALRGSTRVPARRHHAPV